MRAMANRFWPRIVYKSIRCCVRFLRRCPPTPLFALLARHRWRWRERWGETKPQRGQSELWREGGGEGELRRLAAGDQFNCLRDAAAAAIGLPSSCLKAAAQLGNSKFGELEPAGRSSRDLSRKRSASRQCSRSKRPRG